MVTQDLLLTEAQTFFPSKRPLNSNISLSVVQVVALSPSFKKRWHLSLQMFMEISSSENISWGKRRKKAQGLFSQDELQKDFLIIFCLFVFLSKHPLTLISNLSADLVLNIFCPLIYDPNFLF